MKDLPLITLVIVTYNQEAYVRKAVEAAFAQTYSSLEIILSDDASEDNTFLIMRQMVEAYRGIHEVRLDRNEKNVGLVANLNRALRRAKGEFFLLGGGDDISHKDRVKEVVAVWLKSNKAIKGIFSNLNKIDKDGVFLGEMFCEKPVFASNLLEFKAGRQCWLVGASSGFEKIVFKKYGELNPLVRQEDGYLAFRALLEGNIFYLDKPLVQYRIHNNNLSQTECPGKRLKLQKYEYRLKKSWLYDAANHIRNDTVLGARLIWEYRKAWLRSMLFSLPLLGYFYNFTRINTKRLLLRLKIL